MFLTKILIILLPKYITKTFFNVEILLVEENQPTHTHTHTQTQPLNYIKLSSVWTSFFSGNVFVK